MKKYILNISLLLFIASCNAQEVKETIHIKEKYKGEKFYSKNIGNTEPSISKGTVSRGTLINGKLVPYKGNNFQYFDTLSYFKERGFVNSKVKTIMINSYNTLYERYPNRKFKIMECSNKKGGKLFPHRTHQNGLSVDFMMPLTKNNKPYYGLDDLGIDHYWLTFNSKGQYIKDTTISIDFNLVTEHILILEQEAKKNNYKISKVLINTHMLDSLFSTQNGKQLKKSNVYIAKKLSTLINSVHDDHYHIDFKQK